MEKSNMADELNKMLSKTLGKISRSEEENVKKLGKGDLTVSEVRLIETVAENGGCCTVSELAKLLDVTLPTVTVSVNKLEKKGYIRKNKSSSDGRSVLVSLTENGEKTNRLHEYFQEQIIFKVTGQFSDEELENLCKCLRKLNNFAENDK